MFYVSLTFRPPSLMCSSKEFKKFLKAKCGVIRYAIGEEHGKYSQDINHYQCYLESETRGDHIKEALVNQYEIKDAKHGVVQRKVHDDARQYVLGYIQKECNNVLCNIPDDEMKSASDYYSKNRDMFKKKTRKSFYDLDSLYADVYKIHEDAECSEFNRQIYSNWLRTNKTLITGTLWQKINDLKLESYINIMLDEKV